jgi:cytochrome c-type biogenesis protein CcmH
MLWFVMAVMTGFAVVAALWPLAFRRSKTAAPSSEADFFRAQLAEIERDVERGQLPAAEAASARAESARRLIAASAAEGEAKPAKGSLKYRRIAAVAILIVVPVVALGVYLELGRPDIADAPLAEHKPDAASPDAVRLAIAHIEAQLASHPDDARGWGVLTQVYMRLGRFDDAVNAFRQLIRLDGESAQGEADLGEALLAAAGGVVTSDARAAFEHALQLQADLPKARFYLGLAAEQDRDDKKALAIYRELEPKADGSEAWMVGLRHRLAALGAGASPSFSPEQEAMIREMVEGLAARLSQSRGSAEEWARLIRAYSVLKDLDKAKTALTDAREKFAGDAATLGRFDSLARELGL